MIEINGVSHNYGKSKILQNISLSIKESGITALIGPNGAGKSTLLSLMARLQPLQTGSIMFDGHSVSQTPTRELAKTLAILRQDNALSSRMSLRDLVGFGRYPHHKGRPTAKDHRAVEEALDYFDLQDMSGRFIDEVSGGQKQRALVAMAFCQETKYLLLDEPLNNLDMYYARSLMKRLREIADTGKRSFVIVLHDINYAGAYANEIIALKDGTLAIHGPPQDVLETNALQTLYSMKITVTQHQDQLVALHHL
ncbi:iron complex transport system ATP-binding protein [Pseudovibrio ascidiaceicola]|uniref:Iron complex transport system ATP-binding protein n=1 Tax=Pseudovibrio ascidiaceicola TaxID=285279 RepID=A0A1I4DVL4_9HYPH|nr:ATP-binding cassette domain-containing protein [Pseudovibrio ascidiaceicola]SFK97632.1 iron complex transport system ATP-binding protein [Pseudovibrio ascidiaceicola]